MRTTIDSVDRIGESVDRFGESIRVLDSRIDGYPIHFLLNMNDRMQHPAVPVKIANERYNPTFKVKTHFAIIALITEVDGHRSRNESHLPKTLHKCIETII